MSEADKIFDESADDIFNTAEQPQDPNAQSEKSFLGHAGEFIGDTFSGVTQAPARVPVLTDVADAIHRNVAPESYKNMVTHDEAVRAKAPFVSGAKDLAGSIATPPVFKGISRATSWPGKAAQGVANALIRTGEAAATSGGITALQGGTPEEMADSAYSTGKLAGAFNFGAIPAGRGLFALGRGLTGVDKASKGRYMERSDAINKADADKSAIELSNKVRNEYLQPEFQAKANFEEQIPQAELAKTARKGALMAKSEIDPSFAEDIAGAMDRERGNISGLAGELFKIVEDASQNNAKIPTARLKGWLTAKKNAHTDVTPTGRRFKKLGQEEEYDILDHIQQRLNNYGKEVTASQMKDLLTGVYKVAQEGYQSKAGEYVGKGTRGAMQFGRNVRETFRSPEYPMYDQISGQMYDLERGIEGVQERLGKDPAKISTSVKSMNPFKQKALAEFDAATGDNFSQDPRLIGAMEAKQTLKIPGKLQEEFEGLEPVKELARRKSLADVAKAEADPVRPFDSRDNARNAIISAGSKKSPSLDAQEAFGYLKKNDDAMSKLSGEQYPDWQQTADDLYVQRLFKGGDTSKYDLRAATGAAQAFGKTLSEGVAPGGSVLTNAVASGISQFAAPAYKMWLDLQIKNPRLVGGTWDIVKAAGAKGPQQWAIAHEAMKKRDAEYKRITEENGL